MRKDEEAVRQADRGTKTKGSVIHMLLANSNLSVDKKLEITQKLAEKDEKLPEDADSDRYLLRLGSDPDREKVQKNQRSTR